MIDDAPESLAELLTFGNVWHGSCDATSGFRTRAGGAMPYVTERVLMPSGVIAGTVINGRGSTNFSATHLIDFGMPALTTPDDDAAAGKHWWNKTILFGGNKSYSVLAEGVGFGFSGWPYKASDGRTWFLYARYINDQTLGVYVKPLVLKSTLADTFVAPTALIASIALPTDSSGYPLTGGVFVNFDPTSGAHAAIHGWRAGSMWIVEATLIGGTGDSAAPDIALSLTRFRPWVLNPSVSGYIDESDVTFALTRSGSAMRDEVNNIPWYEVSYPVTKRGVINTTTVTSPDDRSTDAFPYTRIDISWTEVLAIGYTASGERQQIELRCAMWSEWSSAVPERNAKGEQMEPTPGHTASSLSYCLSSGGAVSPWHHISMSRSVDNTHPGGFGLARYPDAYTVDFNAPASSGQVPAFGVPVVLRVGANAFALLRADAGTPSGQKMLEMWAGHGFSGHYTSPQLMDDSQPRLAIDPVTGEFKPTTWYYF